MISSSSETNAFPLYSAHGNRRDLGLQHGLQAREPIRAHLDSIQQSLGLSSPDFAERALKFRPLFARNCPHLLEEIDGLAEGAGVTLAGALAVNIRGALGLSSEEGCTSFVIGREGTATGRILIGQNADMLPEFLEYAYVLRLEPDDRPAVLMWTFGGMIGYHGLNAIGVAHMANDLGAGGPARRFGLPHYPLKRLMLECVSMKEIVPLMHRIPLWFNGNYVLCDGEGAILDIEATSAGPEILDDNGRGYIAHSNHFCSSRYATEGNAAATYADSFPRLDRINALLAASFGELSVESVATILSDHQGYPSSICRHAQSNNLGDFETAGVTAASLIAEPERGRLHAAVGNPCLNGFTTYSLRA